MRTAPNSTCFLLQLRHQGDSDVIVLFILLLRNLSGRIRTHHLLIAVKKTGEKQDEFDQRPLVDAQRFEGLRDHVKMPALLISNHYYTGLFQAAILRTGTLMGTKNTYLLHLS